MLPVPQPQADFSQNSDVVVPRHRDQHTTTPGFMSFAAPENQQICKQKLL